MRTVTEVLVDAKALLEKGWTKGEMARDINGKGVSSDSPAAVCFCMSGAASRASGVGDLPVDASPEEERHVFRLAQLSREWMRDAMGGPRITEFNDDDDTILEDVLAVMDKAIEASKK